MPLPFAPPPKESKVYRDLKNLKLTGVLPGDMDTLKGALFAQGIDGSEDEIRRIRLLGEVTGTSSSSGPLADSAVYQNASCAYDESRAIVVVPPGQVWRIQLMIMRNGTDVTLGMIPQLVYLDEDGTVVYADYLFDSATNVSASGDLRLTDNMVGLSASLELTSRQTIAATAVSGSPTSGTKNLRVMGLRVR